MASKQRSMPGPDQGAKSRWTGKADSRFPGSASLRVVQSRSLRSSSVAVEGSKRVYPFIALVHGLDLARMTHSRSPICERMIGSWDARYRARREE
jgi:hypothetical protein